MSADSPYLDLLLEACPPPGGASAGWKVQPGEGSPRLWIHVSPEGGLRPQQGWKLHLSANLSSAEQVLRQALPVLLSERASFKVSASPQALLELNEGRGGTSQVGKFMTIYPEDDAQAVRLAVRLDEATRGLRGPLIASDRPLRPGSRVFYRYASFGSRHMQVPLGEVVALLEGPGGEFFPDRRQPFYYVPEWVEDPFIAAGVATELPKPSRVLAGRYATLATMHRTSRSTIYLAIDLTAMRQCVLKQTSRSEDSTSAASRLRHEMAVLTALAPSPWFPQPYQYTEDEGFAYLAMEDIEGETLESHVRGLAARGCLPSEAQLISWGSQLAQALGSLHERGLVYCDMKSNNVLLTPSGRLRVIDLELAHGPTLPRPPGAGRGTSGYMSPSQADGNPATVSDDIHGLGALLYFIATGAEPSNAPFGPLLARPISLLNPSLSPAVSAVIARCLELEPERRFTSMQELADALQGLGGDTGSLPAAARSPKEEPDPSVYRTLARRLGDTLVHAALRDPAVGAVFWRDGHPQSGAFPSRDINVGSAGIVLTLAALVQAFNEPTHRATLSEAAHWLMRAPRPEGPLHPGLYVGEAGVGLALLRAGQTLGEPHLLQAAIERGREIARLPFASPDLFNGTAGRLRFHLWLWQATGAEEHLQAALAAGGSLQESAQRAGEDGLNWVIPPGYDGLSGSISVGYAHGAAGIADSLLDLYEATGDKRMLETALGAGRWLTSLAVPALEDGSGRAWPAAESQPPYAAMWCHGAVGVAKFLLHATRLDVLPGAGELAECAARTAARGTRWANPVQCHGLAGNIEFLIDTFQATRKREYLEGAHTLAQVLRAFAVEKVGHLYWPAESPAVLSPAYMIGYAGVAACFLRLAEPERSASLMDWKPGSPRP